MTKLLTISEAAEILGLHPETLRRWDREGGLPALKIGPRKDRRYRESNILEFAKENVKLIQYSQTTKYKGYTIAWYSEGYKTVSGGFDLIAKITAEKEGSWIGFAFSVTRLSLPTKSQMKNELDRLPIEKIKEYIDEGLVHDEDVFTFEFQDGVFFEVQNPEWWERKYGKTLTPGLRLEVSSTVPVSPRNLSWRVILRFKSKEGNIWVTNNFGPKKKHYDYFVWISSEELERKDLPNTAKGAEILAVNYGVKRFEETKDKNGDRDITRINENKAACYEGKCVKDSILPNKKYE